MRSKRAGLVLASTIGLAALAAGALVGPAVADAASGGSSPAVAVSHRVDQLKQALQGLVDNGTITAQQRDKVATTLADKLPPPGRRGQGPDAVALDVAASTLGMTPQDLRTQLRSGKSLADVAKDKGVPLTTLTSALQKAAQDRLSQAVTDGRLTQAQADALKAQLPQRIADGVQRKGDPGKGLGKEHRWGPGGPPGSAPQQAPPSGSTQQPSSYLPA